MTYLHSFLRFGYFSGESADGVVFTLPAFPLGLIGLIIGASFGLVAASRLWTSPKGN
jgi:hypothetical protein